MEVHSFIENVLVGVCCTKFGDAVKSRGVFTGVALATPVFGELLRQKL